MELTHDYDGKTYEVKVLNDEKDKLTHLAQLTIKNGPISFKFAHIFGIKSSNSGKKILSLWKGKKSGDKIKGGEERQIKIKKKRSRS